MGENEQKKEKRKEGERAVKDEGKEELKNKKGAGERTKSNCVVHTLQRTT